MITNPKNELVQQAIKKEDIGKMQANTKGILQNWTDI
jgi:hypothetical protein